MLQNKVIKNKINDTIRMLLDVQYTDENYTAKRTLIDHLK